MNLYKRQGRRYKKAHNAEIVLVALNILRKHTRLEDIVERIELRMLLGDVMIPDIDNEGAGGGEVES